MGAGEVGQALDVDPGPPGTADHRALVGARGQLEHDVEAGGDATDAGAGEVGGERLQQGRALAPVVLAGGADVALEGAAGDQVGERPLLEARAAAVGHGPGGDDGGASSAGKQQPAESEGGCEGLGDGARQHDRVRRQALQGAGGPAVVAQLGVVVVLENQGAARARPGDQLAPPRRRPAPHPAAARGPG